MWACCQGISREQVADSKEVGADDTLVTLVAMSRVAA